MSQIQDDTEVTDAQQDSSPGNNQIDSSVSEDANTQDQEAESSDNTSQEEDIVPFHKHPRFQELIRENQEIKKKLDEQEKFKKSETLSAEERAVQEAVDKYGLARKEDLTTATQAVQALKDELEMKELVSSSPDAKKWELVIKQLAYTPAFNTKSFAEIYEENFAGSVSGSDGKRVVKTGLKTISSGNKTSGPKWTKERLATLSPEEYSKNKNEIFEHMAAGKIL